MSGEKGRAEKGRYRVEDISPIGGVTGRGTADPVHDAGRGASNAGRVFAGCLCGIRRQMLKSEPIFFPSRTDAAARMDARKHIDHTPNAAAVTGPAPRYCESS